MRAELPSKGEQDVRNEGGNKGEQEQIGLLLPGASRFVFGQIHDDEVTSRRLKGEACSSGLPTGSHRWLLSHNTLDEGVFGCLPFGS